MNCPLSTLLNDGSNQEVSPQAEFGTQCHELGSALISKSLKLIDYDSEIKSIDDLIKDLDMYSPDMQEIADGYADFVINTFDYEKNKSGEEPLIVSNNSEDGLCEMQKGHLIAESSRQQMVEHLQLLT